MTRLQTDPTRLCESASLREGSPIDQRHFRNALARYATGVTIVTTRTPEGKLEGLTANSFSPVSLDPPLVLWSLKRIAPSMAGFLQCTHFAVNVLAAHQGEFCRHFATPNREKFVGISYTPGIEGCPLLNDVLATFECRMEHHVTGGDHMVFFGRVERAAYRTGEPLIFSAGRFGTHALAD